MFSHSPKNKKYVTLALGILLVAAIVVFAVLKNTKPRTPQTIILNSESSASEMKQVPIEKAAQRLKEFVPSDDTAIDVIVNTYYDLTLYYGNYSPYSIFRKADALGQYEFFLPFFGDEVRQEDEFPEYEAFRLAFFDPNSPAWAFEFPWRTGAGIGGEIAGRKLIDTDTVLVYGVRGGQSYMGAAGTGCKGESDTIDKFIFKKIDGTWKVAEIEEAIDSWTTVEDSRAATECPEINQERITKYQI